jgi:hypothetical protein
LSLQSVATQFIQPKRPFNSGSLFVPIGDQLDLATGRGRIRVTCLKSLRRVKRGGLPGFVPLVVLTHLAKEMYLGMNPGMIAILSVGHLPEIMSPEECDVLQKYTREQATSSEPFDVLFLELDPVDTSN